MFGFGKKIKERKEKIKKYRVDTENLAVPEIHIGARKEEEGENKDGGEITYDEVAVPEIHVRKKKHEKDKCIKERT